MDWSASEQMSHYLWQIRPYFRQVAGQLVLGSICGIAMNTMVVLPAVLLGRAIDAVLALERGEVSTVAVAWAALAFAGGTLLTEGPGMGKRWWLATANACIRANIRADALRGVLAWPMARMHSTPVGDLMARIIGDVDVLSISLREVTIETWDTVLFSFSLMVAMLLYDARLTILALVAVPLAMLLAKAVGRRVSGLTTAAREANSAMTTALQEQSVRYPRPAAIWPGCRGTRIDSRALPAVRRCQRGPRTPAGWTPPRVHDDDDRRRGAGGLAGEREGNRRGDDVGGVHCFPRAISPFCQPWIPRPSDD